MSESAAKVHGKRERVFTSEEMHFHGFDFVASENLQDVEEPREAREIHSKSGSDFAALGRGFGNRKLRLNRSANGLYTIEEIEPPVSEDC